MKTTTYRHGRSFLWLVIGALVALAGSERVSSAAEVVPTFENLHAFSKPLMRPRRSDYLQVGNKAFYTLSEGGQYDSGGLVSSGGTEVEFTGQSGVAKGSSPGGRLVLVGDEIWGTTMGGGQLGMGTVYKYHTVTRKLTTILEFGTRLPNSSQYLGANPAMGLTLDGAGQLWGYTSTTTEVRIFKIDPSSGAVTLVRTASTSTPGFLAADVHGELTYDGVNALWGAARVGGSDRGGVVFKIDQTTGHLQVVRSFLLGGSPVGSLVRLASGEMWGWQKASGTGIVGTVFRINISTGIYNTVASFPNMLRDASDIEEGLVQLGAGTVVGYARIVEPTQGIEGAVYFVTTAPPPQTRLLNPILLTDRTRGAGSVMLSTAANGRFIAVAPEGGAYELGHIFSADLINRTSITSFEGSANQSGFVPAGGLFQDPESGRLVGTTRFGHTGGTGAAYVMRPSRLGATFSKLALGRDPVGELIQHPHTKSLIGATRSGSLLSRLQFGTLQEFVFASPQSDLLTSRVLNRLEASHGHPTAGPSASLAPQDLKFLAPVERGLFTGDTAPNFINFSEIRNGIPGSLPSGPPVSDGTNAWGVTLAGGQFGAGTIYRVNIATHFTESFRSFGGSKSGEVSQPSGALYLQKNTPPKDKPNEVSHTLWGTSRSGGRFDGGTVYQVLTDNSRMIRIVYDFSDSDLARLGTVPKAGLVSDGRGYLWGTTSRGGLYGHGCIFRVNLATEHLELMFSFSGQEGHVPGSKPEAPLMLGADGNLYGTTTSVSLKPDTRKNAGGGSVFRIRFGKKLDVVYQGMAVDDGVPLKFSHPVVQPALNVNLDVTVPADGTTTDFDAVLSGPAKNDYKLVSAPPASLTHGQRITLQVQFNPSVAGPREATLTLGGKSPGLDTFVVRLYGIGTKSIITLDESNNETSEANAPSRHQVNVGLSQPSAVALHIPFSVTGKGASGEDFRVITKSPLIIPAGATSGAIFIEPVDDDIVEVKEEFIHIKLGAPSNGAAASLGTPSAMDVRIIDNDLQLQLDGGQDTYAALGEALTFGFNLLNLAPDTPVVSFWTQNGKPLPNQASGVYFKKPATLADAGVYEYYYRLPGGRSGKSPPIKVWVIDTSPQTITVDDGDSCSLYVPAAGPGLKFEWSGPGVTALNKKTNRLRLNNLKTTDSGVYTCWFGFNETEVGSSDQYTEFTVNVVNQKPQALPPTFPAARIAEYYLYRLPRAGDASSAPSQTIISGLPAGLRYDANAESIVGSPMSAGRFQVTVTMNNSFGTSSTQGTLTVSPLPSAIIGQYHGILGRSGDGSSRYGTLSFIVSASGQVTGKANVNDKIIPFISEIDIIGSNYEIQFRDPGEVLEGNIVLADGTSSGWMVFRSVPFNYGLNVTVWKNIWNAGTPLPSGLAGTFHLVGSILSDPHAGGFSTLTARIGSTGSVIITGRLADNTAITNNTTLTPFLDLLVNTSPYDGRGALSIMTRLSPPQSPGGLTLLGNSATDNSYWLRPKAKQWTPDFPAGIEGSPQLFGSGFVPPAPNELLPGVPQPTSPEVNATLSIGETFFTASITGQGLSEATPTGDEPIEITGLVFRPSNGALTGAVTFNKGTKWEQKALFACQLLQDSKTAYGSILTKIPDSVRPPSQTEVSSLPVILQFD